MADVLAEICTTKRREVERARATRPARELEAAAEQAPPPRSPTLVKDGFGVIAEVKRASPSAGPIAVDADAAEQARTYAAAGAAAVSVLTDAEYFDGSIDDLRAVRDAVDVPLLRKDFTVDAYQVPESRAAGADIVLLIAAALDEHELVALADLIRSYDMTPLVEVHGTAEIPAALAALVGGGILGVNARNLTTLDVDLATWEQVADEVPETVVRIAESGVRSPADAARARAAGYQGVLCGEALMASPDPGAFIRECATEAVR